MKKTLVTGGLGFIGSTLVDKLIKLGYDVYVVDNLKSESASEEYKNPKARYSFGDLRNINFSGISNIDVVFHLGGLARIQPSFIDPVEYFDVNAFGTMEMCEFVKNNEAQLIYASSSSINNGKSKTPYTFSKWVGEEVIETWINCYDINAVSCRFYNVYGNREPKEGEYATVIKKFTEQYKNNEPLTIVGDGKQKRDFTHVDDICNGLIKVSQKKWKGDIIHLGNGQNYSINEVASFFPNAKIKYIPKRKGEGKETLASIKETQNKIIWKPKKKLKQWIQNITK